MRTFIGFLKDFYHGSIRVEPDSETLELYGNILAELRALNGNIDNELKELNDNLLALRDCIGKDESGKSIIIVKLRS